ncbi:hypothetical protein [Paenibacillus paridis]|nr:hypothetical protein [Paenibacillus paridis]
MTATAVATAAGLLTVSDFLFQQHHCRYGKNSNQCCRLAVRRDSGTR